MKRETLYNSFLNVVLSKWFAIGMILVFFLSQFINKGFRAIEFDTGLFGYEYANIAKSIIEGHGYSNPFPFPTGPTSWMTPIIVYYYVLTFKIFGINNDAFIFLTIIKIIGFTVTSLIYMNILNKLVKTKYLYLTYSLLSIVFLLSAKSAIRYVVMDVWIFNLFFSLTLYTVFHFSTSGKCFYGLLALCFLVPVTTPALLPPLFFILSSLLGLFLLSKTGKFKNYLSENIKLKHFILFAIMALLSTGLWTYRNYRLFNKVVITKSNTWFEFYLSNIKDYQGMAHGSTLLKVHPYKNENICKEIQTIGESAWLSQFKDSVDIYRELHPDLYKKKISFRLYSIFIKRSPNSDIFSFNNDNKINNKDAILLTDNGLIKNGNWIVLNSSQNDIFNIIRKLNLSDPELILNDYQYSKLRIHEINDSIRNTFFNYSTALLPFLSLLFLLIISLRRKEYIWIILFISLYFIYFIPYIFISYTVRYQTFIILFQTFLITFSFYELIQILNTRRKEKESQVQIESK